ncbi:MAG TPA: HAMP domain-containing sensor histidine kinase [Vicinamibacterales bacterium]|nr:HAMP domain-containing sensor histidine kinase [Vicinamibacterales bacterium]
MYSKWRERLRHTLGFRLALWYATIFVVSSLGLTGLTYVLVAASLRQYDREIIGTALVQYARAYQIGGVAALQEEIQRTQATVAPGPMLVRTVGARQAVTFFSRPDEWRDVDLSRLQVPSPEGEQTWSTLDTGQDGFELEVASVRLRDGTLFQVGITTERRAQLLQRFRSVLLINVLSLIFVGLAGGAVLTSSALQPLRRLADTVRSILRTGRTDARVPTQDTGDALDELSSLVNAMLDRIDAVLAGMRGALDNVGHDLRTPMTRLRGIAETALSSGDPALLREALADCLEESDRVIEMLNTLMDISEAETGTMALRRERTDLNDLIRQSVELYEDLADERGVEIRTHVPSELVVDVDRNRMRQVLANLIDNAVKYTPTGGVVEIAAHSERGDAVATVSDTGVGIPAEELPRIWDRLYRGDKSRSTRGLGLGLSLVKAIVAAHGGRVDVRSRPGAGSTFELRLPAEVPPPNLSPM